MTSNKALDEICYPFIHDTGFLCDFEVVSDELCSHVGLILAHMSGEHSDIVADLDRLQPLCWHVNGSVRGRLAIEPGDLAWLHQRYDHYKAIIDSEREGFVLPRGPIPVPQLHLARSAAKKVIRAMVRLEEDGVDVPDILKRFCNLMCNFFFVLAGVVNKRAGVVEIPFVSMSYGQKVFKTQG